MLATSILFDQCPNGHTAAALRALAETPPEMGLSYPCNAGWRYWCAGEVRESGRCTARFAHLLGYHVLRDREQHVAGNVACRNG